MFDLHPGGRAGISEPLRPLRKVPVRPVTHPQPMYHVTMAMPLEGMPSGWTARVLVLRQVDGRVEIYQPLVDYLRAHPMRSGTWQDDVARALGLFWDYSQATRGALIASEELGGGAALQDLFRAFALALLKGTIEDGLDPSGLLWPGSTRSVAMKTCRRIEDFSKWCHDRASRDAPRPDPTQAPDDALTYTDILVWSRLRSVSLMKHLDAEPRRIRRGGIVDHGRATKGHAIEAVKAFPRESVNKLLWDGHRRPYASASSDGYGVHNVRDQMMAVLDGWGGLRRSEGLHLWVNDVTEHPERPGHALVVLHHPTEAMVDYRDPISGGLATGTRKQVLNTVFGLRARNETTRGRYHVGWKGMSLDKNHRAVVHWLDERAGAIFWVLYLTYLRHVRKDLMARRRESGGRDHPFLFVSERQNRNGEKAGFVGEPYSEQAYERAHKAAVLRIGLPYGKMHGTTTHGLRHMYGRSLADLNASAGIIQKAMRHVSPLSQLVYVEPDNATTDARLRQAWKRFEAGAGDPGGQGTAVSGSNDDTGLGDDTTQALRRLRATFTDGGSIAKL